VVGFSPGRLRLVETNSSVSILRVTANHVDLAAPLFDQYRQFYRQPPDLPAATLFLKQRLHRQESVVFLALAGRSAVGFMQLYPLFSSIALKPHWLLNDLFVAPAARKTGIATKLLAAAHEFAMSTGAQGLSLETAIDNIAAQALYMKLGWKRDEEFDRYFLSTEKH